VDRFEDWLKEQGIEITGQAATGSGDLVRYQLRLLDGSELDVAFSATTLVERPQDAISLVERMIEDLERDQRRGNGRT
jgi:hypothetical protein